jgi:hypothetical protein
MVSPLLSTLGDVIGTEEEPYESDDERILSSVCVRFTHLR